MSQNLSIIPQPRHILKRDGYFELNSNARLFFSPNSSITDSFIQYVCEQFHYYTNSSLPVTQNIQNASIIFSIEEQAQNINQESYQIAITLDKITLSASKPQGLFYAVQTLLQIIQNQHHSSFSIPCLEIEDYPSFQWRGMLLDCVRHYMTVDFIKRYIDLLAFHKLNTLHLHLTDDQGWRMEIQSYPRLTEVGAWRKENGKPYGGFYTQKQLKGIVEYANSRYITIVPEFDIPGHTTAAIAAYPELSCHAKSIPVQTHWGIFEDILCLGKESTFEFIEMVLDEMLEIFPSPYIHLGGDEAPRTNWQNCAYCQERIRTENLENEAQLQSYLLRKIEPILARQKRRIIGWDEILEGGSLPNSVIVQSWQGMEGAEQASKSGHQVIASPLQNVYFDYPNNEEQAKCKPDWMRVTTLETAYQFRPIPPHFSSDQAQHVLGGECTLWSEHAPQDQVNQQVFPRLCAFSETVWSPQEKLSWNDFQKRLQSHLQRLDQLEVQYFK